MQAYFLLSIWSFLIKIDIVHNITFVLLILFSLFFTFFSNSFVLAIDFAFLIPAQCFWVYTTNGKNRVKHGGKLTQLFVSVFYYPFANYGSAFSALFNKKKGQKGGNGKWIILGLCIALPLVAIVSALLLMGDQMFKAMFSFIFDDFFLHLLKYVAYAILGIPVAMAIFSCLYTKYNEETPHTKAQRHWLQSDGRKLSYCSCRINVLYSYSAVCSIFYVSHFTAGIFCKLYCG